MGASKKKKKAREQARARRQILRRMKGLPQPSLKTLSKLQFVTTPIVPTSRKSPKKILHRTWRVLHALDSSEPDELLTEERRKILLSIDFDFWTVEKPEWDWGHREAPIFASPLLWTTRAASFKSQGLDIATETAAALSPFYPPWMLWKSLSKLGLKFDKLKGICIAESHAAALPYFDGALQRRRKGEHVLINFDAHHDLGYPAQEDPMPDCAGWAYCLLKKRRSLMYAHLGPPGSRFASSAWSEQVHSLRLSYPQLFEIWHRQVYFNQVNSLAEVSSLVSSVPLGTWSVEYIFICRSSSRVPPWRDHDFASFLKTIPGAETVETLVVKGPTEYMDPTLPREFDWAAVDRLVETEKSLMASFSRGK